MELSFDVYELHLDEDEQQQFRSESESFLTKVLGEEGAPDPNELIVHKASADSTDALIEEIIAQVEGSSGGHPPVAAIYHQKSGGHVSRYITIVIQE
jgi:hypothetical protein